MADEVVLLDDYVSMFGMRARVALAEKGVEYEYREESLQAEKSTLFASDEPGSQASPGLDSQREPHLFWANFVDRKVYDAGRRLSGTKEEEQESGKKDFIAALNLLEGELGDKPYFGGENFGFLDVALIPFYTWFPAFETCGNFSTEEHCPKLIGWAKRCMERESVSKSLADPKKVYDFVLFLKKKYIR
ncbi:UNVERIFIED_CONTAM: Glutathione S-transferase U19 [Sesamum radiatum]|uniref:glutathione transferase n=1 Tax=Sesamum radiatum TaxID=300843 RepID=A0AAW2K3T3_SESRA